MSQLKRPIHIAEASPKLAQNQLQTILNSFDFSESQTNLILYNFTNELQESQQDPSSRTIFIATLESTPVGTIQVIYRNADNDPELARINQQNSERKALVR